MFNHPVSDLVARIKNGYMAYKPVINTPSSKLRLEVLKVLKEEGYISNYAQNAENKRIVDIHLKYHNSEPSVNEISVVSKSGRRVYCNYDAIPLVMNGLGTVVISTSQGVMSGYDAKSKKVGGEILLKIF